MDLPQEIKDLIPPCAFVNYYRTYFSKTEYLVIRVPVSFPIQPSHFVDSGIEKLLEEKSIIQNGVLRGSYYRDIRGYLPDGTKFSISTDRLMIDDGFWKGEASLGTENKTGLGDVSELLKAFFQTYHP